MTRITLSTLASATAQQVFDQGARHLLTQGKPCHDDSGSCVYDDGAGNACAGGIFLSPEDLARVEQEDLNGSGWSMLIDAEIAPAEHFDLILDLQDVHDCTEPRDWAERLRRVAAKNHLSAASLDEFLG